MTNAPDQNWLPTDSQQIADPGRFKSLLVSVGFLLSIALLPIGLIAVTQVHRAQERSKESYLDELQTQTARAAQPERDAIIAGFGMAKGLANAVALLDMAGPRCSRIMEQSQFSIPNAAFVGVLRDGGISSCNNMGETFDVSNVPEVRELFEKKQPHVAFTPAGSVSGQPVMIINQPVIGPDGVFQGFIALSIEAISMAEAREIKSIPRALDLVTFNAAGDLLTADMTNLPIEDVLPHNINLATLGEIAPKTFEATTRDGTHRYYAVTPIYPGEAFALASWNPAEGFLEKGSAERTTLLFTFVMWLAGLLMALAALYVLAVRPLSALGRRMRRFASGRRILQYDSRQTSSREVFIINRIFEQMARKILRDEAELENALYERGVLLREVHHRVKNNLQLVSSILNMELRKTSSPEVRHKITRLQGRISGLANVYRGLYESDSFSSVRMDTLLEPLLRQLSVSISGGLEETRLKLDLSPLELTPDQAGQVALLTVEAFSNALDHCARNAEGDNFITVSLRETGDGSVTLKVENSVAETDEAPADGTSLGAQLISAFAMQLDGEVDRQIEAGRYRLSVRFTPAAFEEEPGDQEIPGTRSLLAR